MKKIFFILLTLLSPYTNAEVFKCQLESGKMVYQGTPCQSAVKQEIIEIQKTDPRKAAEAEAKLKDWEKDFAVREETRIKDEQRQAELHRKALQKNMEYQRQQEYQQRQEYALERRNMRNLSQNYRINTRHKRR
jgi:Skp family chaperone for outer membrane proteins